MLQIYGPEAERECRDRAAYCRAKGDTSAAMEWEGLREAVSQLRRIRPTTQN